MVNLCLRIANSFSRRVTVFLSPTAKVCTTQYTKKAQLQRQQTRDWQLSLAIVKAKTVSGAMELRWMDARYQIADCLTKHASRKSEAVLQKIPAELLQKRICWTNANKSERFVTVLPMTKNCGLRTNDQMAKMGCKQEN